MEAPKTGLHGFHRWVDFCKATLSLGLTISALLYAVLTYGLDGRYAPKTLQAQVAENGAVAKKVGLEVGEVRDVLEDVRASLIHDRAFNLKVKSCEASSADARHFYARQIGELEQDYRKITGNQVLPLPTCADLR